MSDCTRDLIDVTCWIAYEGLDEPAELLNIKRFSVSTHDGWDTWTAAGEDRNTHKSNQILYWPADNNICALQCRNITDHTHFLYKFICIVVIFSFARTNIWLLNKNKKSEKQIYGSLFQIQNKKKVIATFSQLQLFISQFWKKSQFRVCHNSEKNDILARNKLTIARKKIAHFSHKFRLFPCNRDYILQCRLYNS